MTAIVDYSYSRPDPAALRRVGYVGVARYLSHDPAKDLTAAERDLAFAAGLSITLAWETTARRALQGAAAGAADGAEAAARAAGLGMPAGLPVYYAIDFDAQPSHLPTVVAYLRAAGAASGRPVGVYGSALVVNACVPAAAAFGWQTAAWSHGAVLPAADLYQRVSPTLARVPGAYDEDACLAADWGQWGGDRPPVGPPEPGPHQPPIDYLDDETGETMHRALFDCGALDGAGNAQIIWGGGQTHEDGVADFSPAIAYDKFRGCWVHGRFAPADGHTPAPGLPTWGAQERDGVVTIEFTGGPPGAKLDVEVSWAD